MVTKAKNSLELSPCPRLIGWYIFMDQSALNGYCDQYHACHHHLPRTFSLLPDLGWNQANLSIPSPSEIEPMTIRLAKQHASSSTLIFTISPDAKSDP